MQGEHVISSSGNNSQIVLIENIEDFTLTGIAVPSGESPAVSIRCIQPIHFHFINTTRLVIQNIRVTNCSSERANLYLFHDWDYYERRKMRDYKRVTGSLTIGNTYTTVLHNVHVTESSGYGLFCYNILGTIKLNNCTFHNNSANGQINGHGGNVLIAYACLMNTASLSSAETPDLEVVVG